MTSQVLTTQAPSALAAWVRLLRGSAALRRVLSADLQSRHGLSINDYEALLVLSRAEDGRLRREGLVRERRARHVRGADEEGPRAAHPRFGRPHRGGRHALRAALFARGAGDARGAAWAAAGGGLRRPLRVLGRLTD